MTLEAYIGLILSVLLNIILVVLIGRYRVQENEKDVTEEEIRQMVDAGGDSGTIDENVKEMLNNIFELSNSSAGDIATHGCNSGGNQKRHGGGKIFPYRGV